MIMVKACASSFRIFFFFSSKSRTKQEIFEFRSAKSVRSEKVIK